MEANSDLGFIRMLTQTDRRGRSLQPKGQFAFSEPTNFLMLSEFERAMGQDFVVKGEVVEDNDWENVENDVETVVNEEERRELKETAEKLGIDINDLLRRIGKPPSYESDDDGWDNRSITPEPIDGLDLSKWESTAIDDDQAFGERQPPPISV